MRSFFFIQLCFFLFMYISTNVCMSMYNVQAILSFPHSISMSFQYRGWQGKWEELGSVGWVVRLVWIFLFKLLWGGGG